MALMVTACPLPGTDSSALAETARRGEIDIPSLPLTDALAVLARQAGISIGFDGEMPDKRAPAVHNAHDVGNALARLLVRTNLEARQVGTSAWRLVQRKPTPVRTITPAPPRIEVADESAIVVTATKQNEARFDIPLAISVVSLAPRDRHDTMRDTGFVAGEVEGLNLTALGPGRNRLFLRGVADSPFNDDNQSPVAVVLDESRLTYSAPDPDLRLVDVERVELLKGPQGTLYGLGTLGGVYHIVTAKPDVDRFTGSVSAGLNFIVHGALGESGSAVINLPILPGRAALRVVGYEVHEPGWIDTGNRLNSNFTKVGGGRAALSVELGDGWQADFGTVTQHLNTSDSQYNYLAGSFTRAAQLAEPNDNDLDHYSVRLSGNINGLKAVLLGGYTVHEVSEAFDATIGAGTFGLPDPRLFQDERSYQLAEVELRLNGSLGRLEWLLGIAHIGTREVGTRTLSSFDAVPPMVIDNSSRKTRETGLFGQINMPLTAQLRLEVGGRVYHSEQRGEFTSGPQSLTQQTSGWALTPAVALSWRLSKDRLLYLHYGTADRPGTMDFSWHGKVRQLVGDKVRTLVAGWHQRFAAGGDFDADGFVTWWQNIQTDHVLPSGLIAMHNAGDARILGAEATLNVPLARGWRTSTGVTVQDAETINASPAILAHHIKLPAIPSFTLRGVIDHEFQVGPTSANVKLSLRYLGPTNLSFDPSLNQSMGHVLESRLDAGVNWGHARADIQITNLLNRLDNRFAYGNPFRMGTPQYTPQRPFGASLVITRSF